MADVKDFNPYRVLRVSRQADVAEIEDAYDRLFDQYEPQAYAGDSEATRMLEELNRARDALVDPERRAALDARLSGAEPRKDEQRASAEIGRGAAAYASGPRAARTGARAQREPQSQTRIRARSGRRPRAVAPRRQVATMPLVLGGLAALVLVVVIVFLISRNLSNTNNTQVNTNPGAVVATVNGTPIYERELNAVYELDKQQQLGDPLMRGVLKQGGDALARALDVIKQDALDKLINMEVIQQEARAENMYPSAQTQKDLITQAKQADVKAGQSFEDSLREHGLTEEQYNQNVIRSAVYRVMASKYMAPTGDENTRQTAFISWICQTRAKYDVKINITFQTATGNQPCSSGLPSDIPLTADQLPPTPEEPPAAEPTSEAPVATKTP